MRAALVLAVLTIASMLQALHPLPLDAPQVLVQGDDCTAAQRVARMTAQALGFSQSHSICVQRAALATLSAPTTPRSPSSPDMVTYSVPVPREIPAPGISATFMVPSAVPWVSANGSVSGYFRPDAVLLRLAADDLVATAFALENAGISRDDIINDRFADQTLYVRVRPVTVGQVLKIANAAEQLSKPPAIFRYSETLFVKDCDGAIASLTGPAIAVAREKATVMARAARTGLGALLGAVDPGGSVIDAVCGLGGDSTVAQLAAAARLSGNANTAYGGLHAAIVRSISVAWRLKLPPNPAGDSWRLSEDFSGGRLSVNNQQVAFLADGRRVHGGALIGGIVVPNRAYILIPDWSYEAIRRSAFAADLTRLSLGMNPMRPALLITSPSAGELSRRVGEFQSYASGLAKRAGKSLNLGFFYTQDDCRSAIDSALMRATLDGIAKLDGKPVRYLQETQSGVYSESVFCMHEPTTGQVWSDPKADKVGAADAFVAVGY